MRSFILVAVLGSMFGACAQPSGGKGSAEELGQAVIASLVAKDEVALLSLVATADQGIGSCPSLADKRAEIIAERAKSEAALSASFADCQKVDWAKAAIVASRGGDARGPMDGCPDFVKLRDLTLTVDVAGKSHTVRLKKPITLGGRYFLDDIQCAGGAASNPLIEAIGAAADKVCQCKDVACANQAAAAFQKTLKDKPLDGLTPDDAKMVGKATKRMSECLKELAPAPK